ncbi:MAG: DUF3536 domain-containing protein [Anaerolineaceae bacterium]|nr:DUF3536 domain-containing protein [Anaerolineaceae bacterium]
MQKKFLGIHGHFYQPPREDPISAKIPFERGAAPYDNWNERINDQCYRPNAIAENFKHISFNLGPTLVEWLENFDEDTLARIVDQERINYMANGIGNAMAQPYNHTILPLATRADKHTQIEWGIRHFENTFHHMPSGMWLPEAAVNLETLEVMAKSGIEFTILAPWQAKTSVRSSFPYLVNLPDGRDMKVFFYNQELSGRVSFDPGATANADQFLVNWILPYFSSWEIERQNSFQMISTDGELYGHHQVFRDKFLSHLLNKSFSKYKIESSYPGLWLKETGIEEIEIKDNTSWSCAHGITRWMGNCECTPNSNWKTPLREGFDRIANKLDLEFEKFIGIYLADPWELLHKFIHVLNEGVPLEELIEKIVGDNLNYSSRKIIPLLLFAQFEKQKMFTSCGWFFDDFDRIEPQNNVAYAAQAVWLTYLATGNDISDFAEKELKKVISRSGKVNAAEIFQKYYERARTETYQFANKIGL